VSISGLYVVARPGACEDVIEAINRVPGMEVHQVDRKTGRMVIVEDSQAPEGAGLQRLRRIEGVQLAELVYHYLDASTGGGLNV